MVQLPHSSPCSQWASLGREAQAPGVASVSLQLLVQSCVLALGQGSKPLPTPPGPTCSDLDRAADTVAWGAGSGCAEWLAIGDEVGSGGLHTV